MRSAGGVLERVRMGKEEGRERGRGRNGEGERESNKNIHRARERAQKHTHHTHTFTCTHTHTCLGPTKLCPPATQRTRGREILKSQNPSKFNT